MASGVKLTDLYGRILLWHKLVAQQTGGLALCSAKRKLNRDEAKGWSGMLRAVANDIDWFLKKGAFALDDKGNYTAEFEQRQREKEIRQRHRAAQSIIAKKWYKENKARRNKASSAWYSNNKERAAISHKAWRKANPNASNTIWQNRRARKESAEGKYTVADVEELFDKQKGRCIGPVCNKMFDDTIECTVDHKVPLSRGGTNWPSNLQLLCRPCNSQKHDKTDGEWRAKFNIDSDSQRVVQSGQVAALGHNPLERLSEIAGTAGSTQGAVSPVPQLRSPKAGGLRVATRKKQ